MAARLPYRRTRRMTFRARELRRQATDAERRLWARLRGDQLGVRFRRHLVFDRRFVLDFYAPALRLAVEVDGGQHAGMAARDAARSRYLAGRGVTVLRFWNNEVLGNIDGVVTAIADAAARLRPHASPPSPLPEGGGCAGRAAPPRGPAAVRVDRGAPESVSGKGQG